MAYDFPDAPSLGQVYAPTPGGPSWSWDGDRWVGVSAEGAIGEAPADSTLYGRKNGAWEEAIGPVEFDAMVAAINADLALRAPLASPVFTGDPTAPTPAPGDNDTSIATTAYTTAAIAAAVAASGGFPEAPNDGKPYARQSLGWNDLTDELAAKAPLASPTFTGSPAAPTPATADNDTSIATTAFVKAALVPGISMAMSRNYLVNGAFMISQENTPEVPVSGNVYTVDQWVNAIVTSGSPTSVMIFSDPTANYLRMQSGAIVDASVAAGDVVFFMNKLEGVQQREWKFGTAAAKPLLLRFTARLAGGATTLNLDVSLRNGPGNRSYVHRCGLTTAWQEFVIPIPGDTTGTWPTDSSVGSIVTFAMMAGTTYHVAALDSWQASGGAAAAGVGNIMAIANTLVDFRNVGLYLDPNGTGVPPPWEEPNFAEELARCQRYWQQGVCIYSGNATSGSNYYGSGSIPVPPRPGAAISGVNGANVSFAATVGTLLVPLGYGNFIRENRSCTATANGFFSTTVTVNGRM